MKKLLPLIIAMILLLTACFNSKQNDIQEQAPSPTPSPGPELVSINKIETDANNSALGVLFSDYISALDPWVTAGGYKSLTCFSDSAYEFGDEKAYTICPAPGLFLNVYSSVKNQELNQLVYWLDTNSADENTREVFFQLVKATVYGLDYEKAETILADLDYRNSAIELENLVNSEHECYIYSVDSKSLKFYVLPQ